MPRARSSYLAVFRERIAALHRAGRGVEGLARETKACAATTQGWVKQADRYAGRRAVVLSGAGREELRRLRRENRQLHQKRDILAKAAPLVFGPRL